MLEIVEATDHGLLIAMLVEELRRGPRPTLMQKREMACNNQFYLESPTPIKVWSDSQSSIDTVLSNKDKEGVTKRRRLDIADLKECVALELTRPPGFINGEVNPMDVATKDKGPHTQPARAFRRLMYGGFFFPLEVPEVSKKTQQTKRNAALRQQQENQQ